MDKYRLLQEQAREHMQKVLELSQDTAEKTPHTKYCESGHTQERGAGEEQYTPVHRVPQPPALQHTLQLPLPLPHDTTPHPFLWLSSLAPLLLLCTTSAASASFLLCSPHAPSPPPPSPPLSPPHTSTRASPMHLPPLFPSILLSHRPIPLLHPSVSFHTSLSPLTLQPLAPQPSWTELGQSGSLKRLYDWHIVKFDNNLLHSAKVWVFATDSVVLSTRIQYKRKLHLQFKDKLRPCHPLSSPVNHKQNTGLLKFYRPWQGQRLRKC
ncbi:hypothetical protein WMY93_026006 [Mugilogobius chulae]|uniref:Uncharacterized protein n=1 Tax=Mugilogobius chulae TaxID=88201 RepID=A0AAW0N843_9GOBI